MQKPPALAAAGRQRGPAFTFPALQLGARSLGDVVGRVAAEAAAGGAAQAAVGGAALAAPLGGVVEGLGTGVQAPAPVEVALHSKLIWSKTKRDKREYF